MEAETETPQTTWTTEELRRDFVVEAFAAPYVVVSRRADHVRGTLQFNHGDPDNPRLYRHFVPMG